MHRTLRLSVLLALVLALIPASAGAQDLDVSFEVVRVTPTSATIRATISGASGPLSVTARIDDYRGNPTPAVQGIAVAGVQRIARYRHTTDTETVLVPIADTLATIEAEVEAMRKAPAVKGEDNKAREEAINGKEDELTALYAQAEHGATHISQEVVTAHRYALEYIEKRTPVAAANDGDTVLLPPQSWADAPPQSLIAAEELTLPDTEVGWGDGVSVYEYTVATDSIHGEDGWGTSGILVLTINGRDYYDDTNSSWWDETWPYRMKLTIDNSASTENLIDFPMMVKLTPERFDYSFAQVDGDDIRFVDSDGTALDYECDTWELDGDSFFWVRVPQIDALSTADYFWMYYGTPTVGSGENVAAVWNAGYEAVYHMNDNPADSTQILDSTKNRNHGTKGEGAAAPTEVDGAVGRAQQFVAASLQTIDLGNSPLWNLAATGATFSVVWQGTDASDILRRFIGGIPGAGYRIGAYALPNGSVVQEWRAADGTVPNIVVDGSNVLDDETHYIAFSTDVVATTAHGRCDALTASRSFTGTPLDYNARLGISQPPYYLDGLISELRISSVARSGEWIEAEYLAMWDSMLTYGDTEDYVPEEEPETDWILPTLIILLAFIALKERHVMPYTAAALALFYYGFTLTTDNLGLSVGLICFGGYMLWSVGQSILRRA